MIWTALLIALICGATGLYVLKSSGTAKLPILGSFGVICGCVLIYFSLGNIEYADQPHKALREKEQELASLSADQLIEKFENGLKEKDSAKARLVLANTLVRLGRISKAQLHYKAAYELDNGETPKITMAYAEFLIMLNNKKINLQAFDLINKTLTQDSKNIKALFYKGLYYAQINDKPQAIKAWQTMIQHSLDIPYHNMFKQRLKGIIKTFNIKYSEIS